MGYSRMSSNSSSSSSSEEDDESIAQLERDIELLKEAVKEEQRKFDEEVKLFIINHPEDILPLKVPSQHVIAVCKASMWNKAYAQGAAVSMFNDRLPSDVSKRIASFFGARDAQTIAMTCKLANRSAKESASLAEKEFSLKRNL